MATVLAMAALILMASASGLTVGDAVADPHEFHRHRFLGIVSNAGVLAWTAVVTVCLFAAATVADDSTSRRWRDFYLASAGFTFMLLVDDFLLVHEYSDEIVSVFIDFDRTREQKDVLEMATFAGYAAVFGTYVWIFRDRFAKLDTSVLVLALAMFALSLVVDVDALDELGVALPDEDSALDLRSLVEEGLKLLGIVYFATFYLRSALAHSRDMRTA